MKASGVKPSAKKNYFHITFAGSSKRVTFHMLSAGLGGKHPKHHGASASHTEQIARGLLSNPNFQKKILDKLGETSAATVKTVSAYSSNECCNKNNSMPDGCRSIPTEDLSMQQDDSMPLTYLDGYSTGGGNNKTSSLAGQNNTLRNEIGMGRKDPVDSLYDADSDDEYLETNNFRGQDLEHMSKFDYCMPIEEDSNPAASSTPKKKKDK